MNELTIRHQPAIDDQPAKVIVGYRANPAQYPQFQEVPFAFTLTPEERGDIQWYLEDYLDMPIGPWLDKARHVEEFLVRKGEELFQVVFGEQRTYAFYMRVADDLANTRVVIQCDAADTVGIAVPWELLRDPARGEMGLLSRYAHTFARSQPDLPMRVSEAKPGETFNILMVICRPAGEGDVPFQSVARPLLELFRPHRDRIRLDILRPPTLEQLRRVLEAKPGFYHVLHFDGHGSFPNAPGSDKYALPGAAGMLLFETADGGEDRVTGQALGAIIAGYKVPLVLLNACQSGMTHPDAAYPSVGNELLKAGVCGVVAMAYSVYVSTAMRFMARLYEGLIRGEELGRAVRSARETLMTAPKRPTSYGEIRLQDWLVPVHLETVPMQVMPRPIAGGIVLDATALSERQAVSQNEVDCPRPPDYGFIGRDAVMLELERAFQQETIALLHGMAGIGKTEAAVAFARWRAETGALEGPILFSSFEHRRTLADVCEQVAGVFEPLLKQQLNTEWHLLTDDARRAVTVSLLKQIPCLLVWDNFEPVDGFPTGTPSEWSVEERNALRDFLNDLRGGRTKVLITSRRDEPWLGRIYRPVTLRGLRLREAKELAALVLGRAGVNLRTLKDYDDLLKYLVGNPLAIQVILPELRNTAPDALLTALQSGAAQLPADDTKLGRSRSLAASLLYRLDHLDTMLRHRLGLLGLFQGFVNAQVLALMSRRDDAPALVQGMETQHWTPLLNQAAEVGLLRRVGEGYYTVHPALPWFFHDLMNEAFQDTPDWPQRAFLQAYDAYGNFLQQSFQSNAAFVMSLLQAEETNLTFSLRMARETEQWNDAEGILYGISQLWKRQGRHLLLQRLLTELITTVTDSSGQPLGGREGLWRAAQGILTETLYFFRDFDASEQILKSLHDYYENAGDERNQAVALQQLGMIAQERRDFDEAEQWYKQSLEINKRIRDEHGEASTLHQLGMIAQERRQFDEAEQWYKQSLEIEKRIKNEHGEASTLHQLGNIAEEGGSSADAIAFFGYCYFPY